MVVCRVANRLIQCRVPQVSGVSEFAMRVNARRGPQGISGILARTTTRQWRAWRTPEGRAPRGLWPRCAPWQWVHHSRRGRALPQTPWDALKYQKLAGHDTVPCPASFWCFRVRHARQCKAWSAGNIGHIGKDHNAAVARMANSRRARPTGPVAALRPLAMGPPFPAGTRLATDPVGRAEIPETCGTRH